MTNSKATQFKAGDIVEVHWIDAWATDYDDMDMDPMPLVRVGYVLNFDKRGIKLAGQKPESANFPSRFRTIHFIPQCNVVKIVKVK